MSYYHMHSFAACLGYLCSMLHRIPREDTYLQKGLRKKLVEEVRLKCNITDTRVLAAMEAVPRHFFLDTAFERQAYEDRSFTITADQTISHPSTVAVQTQLLELHKYDKVLEIGTGSGYQACVLAEMGITLLTIERQKELYDQVGESFFLKKYPNIKRFFGDGFAGLPSFAPFNKILITCGAPFIPPKLLEQLKPGGMMVVPIGENGQQKMTRVIKSKDGSVTIEEHGDFSFVPMLEGRNTKHQ